MTHRRPEPMNATDLLAQLLLDHDEPKYVVLRVAQCLIANKVRIGDRDGLRAALREGGVTFGLRHLGEVLALRNMIDEVEGWAMQAGDLRKGKCFGPLSPKIEAWIGCMPSKAEKGWAEIDGVMNQMIGYRKQLSEQRTAEGG